MRKKIKVGCMVAMMFLMYNTSSVKAATTDTTLAEVIIQSGGMNISTPSAKIDFGTILIDGKIKTKYINLGTMSIGDLTGTGAGWNVQVQASQFTNGTHSLPKSSLSLQGIQSITPNETTSPSPTIVGSPPYILDGGSAQKIMTASANKGMGIYNVTFVNNALRLDVNTALAVASETPYQSMITWSVTTGP